jgi:hypothetical protein
MRDRAETFALIEKRQGKAAHAPARVDLNPDSGVFPTPFWWRMPAPRRRGPPASVDRTILDGRPRAQSAARSAAPCRSLSHSVLSLGGPGARKSVSC